MISTADKQKKRAQEAARKIAEAFVAIGHPATVEERWGLPCVTIGDMIFKVTEPYGKRAGTWQIREPNDGVETTVYCPGTVAALGERERSSLSWLIRRVGEERDRKQAAAERAAVVDAACKILEQIPPVQDGKNARRVASAGSVKDYRGECGDKMRFDCTVPLERAEEFARLLVGFFGV